MNTRASAPGSHRKRPAPGRHRLIGAVAAAVVAVAVTAGVLLTAYTSGSGEHDTVSGKGGTPKVASGPSPSTPPTSAPASPSPSKTSPSPSASPHKSTEPSASATPPRSTGARLTAWPAATADRAVTATIEVAGSYDGGLKLFHGSGALGSDGQDEDQGPLFELADGATLQNVILGSPAADGVHCLGSCTLRNVWWEDVGEDAATFKGTSASATYRVIGGGARHAEDKVFQHNGAGTLTIETFQVADFGKLYRSCGNCDTQYERHVVIRNVKVTGPGNAIAGINANYGDTATLSGVRIVGDSGRDITVCARFQGNDSGAEPRETGSGPDGTFCRYGTSDVTYS
jgi:pectate lyase